jgi:hypothetical protein
MLASFRNLGAALLLLGSVSALDAGARENVSARDGLELATSSAHNWAEDSVLVYLENDDIVDAQGSAARWGYLFYSAHLDRWRAYSLSDDKVENAGELGFAFDAPQVEANWIDSDRAYAAAEKAGGRAYRDQNSGALRSMLLIRGAFGEDDPNRTTWTLVYDSAHAPSLFVVVDAENGDVVRAWKG